MEKIKAKKLLTLSTKRIRDGLRTNAIIVFDDGIEKPLSYREIIANRYVWEVLNLFPNVPILSNFDITNYYVNGSYVANTFNKTYEAIIAYLIDNVFDVNTPATVMQSIWKVIQDTFNDIYNEVVFSNLSYITNLDITEFLQIATDPRLVKTMRDVTKVNINDGIATSQAIDDTYKMLDTIVRDGSYPNNKLVRGYLSKTMKLESLRQILASRGKITNLSGELYKHPIASSFTLGMYGIHEVLIESQTGAKALKTTSSSISDSEYLARKIQLAAGNAIRAVKGDCGNPTYIDWYVAPPIKSQDENMKGHLQFLVGKWYFDPVDGIEKCIKATDTHLTGTTIKLRVAYGCKHMDRRCICSKCLGRIFYSLPPSTHLGHFSTTSFSQKVTQGMLSTKHNTASADSSPIVINPAARKDFEPKSDSTTLVCLKKRFEVKDEDDHIYRFDNKKDFTSYIKVASGSFRCLADITPNTDIKRFSPFNVSYLSEMYLVKTNKSTGEVLEIPVEIKKAKSFGSFTIEFLTHIQQTNYTLDEEEYIHIPLEGWDYSKPIIVIKDVEFNYANFISNINRLFGSKVLSTSTAGRKKVVVDDDNDSVFNITTQEGFLYRLFTEVNSMLSVNIAHLEVITAAFSVDNYETGNYGIAHGSPTASIRNIKTILFNRSCGGIYAYQEHLNSMLNPKTFDLENNVDHIMDVFLTPNETVQSFKENPLPTS